VGKAKIIQRGFPLYVGKSGINHILWLALNVVQYYIVGLKVITNVAAATTIAASEERKQCQIGETGKRNIGCCG
jgi:hypothetical protein